MFYREPKHASTRESHIGGMSRSLPALVVVPLIAAACTTTPHASGNTSPMTQPTSQGVRSQRMPAPQATTAVYSAFDRRSVKKANLTLVESNIVRAVRAVSDSTDRRRLMFAFWKDHADLRLFYGPRSSGENAGPIPFLVIGTCNLYFMNGYFGAVPGDGAGCSSWKPSAADTIVIRSQKPRVR